MKKILSHFIHLIYLFLNIYKNGGREGEERENIDMDPVGMGMEGCILKPEYVNGMWMVNA